MATQTFNAQLQVTIAGKDTLSRATKSATSSLDRLRAMVNRVAALRVDGLVRSMEKVATIATRIGSRALLAGLGAFSLALRNTIGDLNEIRQLSNETGRSIEELGRRKFPLADSVANSLDAVERLQASWRVFASFLGSTFMNAVTPFVREAAKAFETLSDWIFQNQNDVETFFGAIIPNVPTVINGVANIAAGFISLGIAVNTATLSVVSFFREQEEGARRVMRLTSFGAQRAAAFLTPGGDSDARATARIARQHQESGGGQFELSRLREVEADLRSRNAQMKQAQDELLAGAQALNAEVVSGGTKWHERSLQNQEDLKQTRTAMDGLRESTAAFMNEGLSVFAQVSTAVTALATSMQQAAARNIQGLIEGTVTVKDAIRDMASAFISSLISIVAQMLATIAVAAVLAGIMSVITGGTSAAAGAATWAATFGEILKSAQTVGGVLGTLSGSAAAGQSAPSTQRPPTQTGNGIIIQSGTNTAARSAMYQDAMIESGGGGQTSVTINAIDSQSFEDAIRRNPKGVTDVVRESLARDPKTRQAVRGAI